MTTGILAALHEEVAGLIALMASQDGYRLERIGMRDYHTGTLEGQPCVVALARIGKVAAAATAVTMIREFGARELIFTGLAGAMADQVKVGDMVLASHLVQHDLDARPLFAQHEVPLLGCTHFAADPALTHELGAAARFFLTEQLTDVLSADIRHAFGMTTPTLHQGLIASGDQFIAHSAQVQLLLAALPATLAVEMEGAAVAQICFEYAIPCAIIRTISDRADATAHTDFGRFLNDVASHYASAILARFFAARTVSTRLKSGYLLDL